MVAGPGPHGSFLKQLFVQAGWFPTLVFLAHAVSLSFGHLYRSIPNADIAFHIVGGVAIAYFYSGTLALLQHRGRIRSPDRGIWQVLILALTATAAVFWEFAEFASDQWLGTRYQLNLDNTMSDMAFGILGGLVFVAFASRLSARR